MHIPIVLAGVISRGRVSLKSVGQIFENGNVVGGRESILSIKGFVEYKRREFCNDVDCPVQVELNKLMMGSDEYEKVRKTCSVDCRYTTWQFHHWLIEKGYLIVRPKDEGGK